MEYMSGTIRISDHHELILNDYRIRLAITYLNCYIEIGMEWLTILPLHGFTDESYISFLYKFVFIPTRSFKH